MLLDENWFDCCDEYKDEVPDEHFAICLKVLRTARNACLGNHLGFFDADGAVTLSYAHAKLKEIYLLGEAEQTTTGEDLGS